MVSAISTAAAAQQGATEEVSANIEQIAGITQGTVAGAKESANAVQELSALATDLQKMLGKFKVSWSEDPAPQPAPWHGGDGPFLPGEAEGQFVDGSFSSGDDAFSATAR